MTIRFNSQVDKKALQNALQTLVDRHEVLRTVYFRKDSELMQQVLDYQPVDFKMTNVVCQSWEEVASLVEETAREPFDLKHDCLLRCRLFSRDTNDHLCLIVTNHIAVDALAFALLLNEFRSLYQVCHTESNQAYHTRSKIVLPPVKFSFSDYLRCQTEMLQGKEGERLWHYWQKQLSGNLKRLNLPTDYPRPSKASHYGACYSFEIDDVLTQKLRNIAQNEAGTLYRIFLTALNILLHYYTKQDDILVATHTLNRARAEFFDIVGYLAETTIIRTKISDQSEFLELLRQVGKTVSEAKKYQGYPMKLLSERLHFPEDICSVWLTMLPRRYSDERKIKIKSAETGVLNMEPFNNIIPSWLGVWYELEISLTEEPNIVSGLIAYSTDLFKEGTIAKIINDFKTLLKTIASAPTIKIQNLLKEFAFDPQ
ncbi:MAG: hypothetical protein HQK72_01935 [Desulfamplus sp.]|nr:hypothetical protein [Desulfamplus sp.]